MNVDLSDSETLRVSGITELVAAEATTFRDAVRQALEPRHRILDIDLSETVLLDSSGLGALISLHHTLAARQGRVRIIRPTPVVRQALELTRLHRVLELVTT